MSSDPPPTNTTKTQSTNQSHRRSSENQNQPPDPLQGGIHNLAFLANKITTTEVDDHQHTKSVTNTTSSGVETGAPPSPNSKTIEQNTATRGARKQEKEK
ncbi:hypothetical protein QL285_094594 [Trifolium repens]|jgi:hypothetical protein|nr:hypothetical protein QL285_094594 [Trifolium repens]